MSIVKDATSQNAPNGIRSIARSGTDSGTARSSPVHGSAPFQ